MPSKPCGKPAKTGDDRVLRHDRSGGGADCLPLNLVAADVSPLTLPRREIRADSRRLLRFRGATRKKGFRGILSLNGKVGRAVSSERLPTRHGEHTAACPFKTNSTGLSPHCPRTRRNKSPGSSGTRIKLVGTGSPRLSHALVVPRVVVCTSRRRLLRSPPIADSIPTGLSDRFRSDWSAANSDLLGDTTAASASRLGGNRWLQNSDNFNRCQSMRAIQQAPHCRGRSIRN